MELEELDNINKNDFLPLLTQNIKQELFDPVNEEGICDSPDKQQQQVNQWRVLIGCNCPWRLALDAGYGVVLRRFWANPLSGHSVSHRPACLVQAFTAGYKSTGRPFRSFYVGLSGQLRKLSAGSVLQSAFQRHLVLFLGRIPGATQMPRSAHANSS